jgi:hypothetical protein
MKQEDIDKAAASKARKIILTALKEAYFRRAKKEKLGSSKQLTEEIDLLEVAINELLTQIKNEG